MKINNIFESRRPLIAILRGITPLEAESVSDVLIEAGISIIEVPLNSPQPFETIERMVKFHSENGIFGAGTVLRENDVYRVQEVGGKIIVSPNLNTLVIKKTKELNLYSMPGVFTTTECWCFGYEWMVVAGTARCSLFVWFIRNLDRCWSCIWCVLKLAFYSASYSYL